MEVLETNYNGIHFKSKLEAETAKTLDEIGLQYEYEPQGFEFDDGIRYLPDFYLPMSDQILECKGIMDNMSLLKIEDLVKESKKDVIVSTGNNFFMYKNVDGEPVKAKHTLLLQCKKCGFWFFKDFNDEIKQCECCGNKVFDFKTLRNDKFGDLYQRIEMKGSSNNVY